LATPSLKNARQFVNGIFRRHDAVIGVYDEASNVIDAHEQGSDVKEREVLYQSAVIRGGSSVW
jgi:hypothetical protein